MIEESNFTNDKIKKEMIERYGIDVIKIETINKGTASIYKLLDCNNNEYILKEFQYKYSTQDVLKEIKAIEYLKQKSKIPLPNYIKNKENRYYFIHEGKTVVIQDYIQGNVYNKNEGSYEQILESAHYLGEIIKNFEGIDIADSINIEDWYSKQEIEKANRKYEKILLQVNNKLGIENKIKEDIIFKKQLLKELNEIIDFSEINNITHKVSHGDYSSLQFIYDDNNKIKAIIDFIKVKKLPIVWEIARSYSYIDKEMQNGGINIANLIDYTKEVTKIIKLSKYDLKYLPYVYLIQLARSTFGYEEYFKNVNNKEELLSFAFYRTDICRDLYKKSNEISNKLLDIGV